jgi:hypothetical protein
MSPLNPCRQGRNRIEDSQVANGLSRTSYIKKVQGTLDLR